MCHKPALLLFVLALGPFLSPEAAAAQDDKLKIAFSPFSVTAQFSTSLGANCNSGKGLIVQLHYAGAQPLRGYLVRLTARDAVTDRVFTGQTVQEVRDSREPMIADGAEWTRTICSVAEINARAAWPRAIEITGSMIRQRRVLFEFKEIRLGEIESVVCDPGRDETVVFGKNGTRIVHTAMHVDGERFVERLQAATGKDACSVGDLG